MKWNRECLGVWIWRGLTPLCGRAIPVLLVLALVGACSPRVEVAAPKEPITINLNIKLDADVRVKLEETAQEDIQENPDVF